MKRLQALLKFRNILTFTLVLFFFKESHSQPLFSENFNFPVRDSLEGIGGWARSGSNSGKKIKVISPGLSYAGYIASGIGNTAFIANQANGDVNIAGFTQVDTGKVYMSFMMRVDSLTSSATEGYSICLDEAGGNTNLNTRVFIKRINSTTFNIGIRKLSGSTKYSSVVYSTNTTYLIICSYTFIDGLNNNIARIYIGSSGVPATEPAVPSAADTTGDDVSNIGEVALLNSFIQTGLQGSSVKIDGIRIGTSWASTLFQPFVVQLNLKAFIQGFYNNSTGLMVKDTVRVFLRNQTAPYSLADSSKSVLDINGNGVFNFNRVGNSANYFLVVKHRNTVETWSSTAGEFWQNLRQFDFTPFASYAFGNNQILKGTKYCLFNGDINQDGSIDLTDIVAVHNNVVIFSTGYIPTDVDGNNITDLTDLIQTHNNSSIFVSLKRP